MNENPPDFKKSCCLRLTVATILFFSMFFVVISPSYSEKLASNLVSARFIIGWENEDETIQGALLFELAPSWKTYWRNPGEYGVAPKFSWSKSTNVKKIEFSWPTPKLFNQFDVPVLGYSNKLLLPIKITRENSLKPVILDMDLNFGICSDICILKSLNIVSMLDNPASSKPHGPILLALENSPKNHPNEEILSLRCNILKAKNELVIRYKINFKNKPQSQPVVIFEYLPGETLLEAKNIKTNGNEFSIIASLEGILVTEGLIQRKKINTFFLHDDTAFELRGCD